MILKREAGGLFDKKPAGCFIKRLDTAPLFVLQKMLYKNINLPYQPSSPITKNLFFKFFYKWSYITYLLDHLL